MNSQALRGEKELLWGRTHTGCGKTLGGCHSERSEESRQLLFQPTTEILRRLRLLRV